jgi:hypothetical protein
MQPLPAQGPLALEIGQAVFQGRALRPWDEPVADSVYLGFGNHPSAGPATDFAGADRPSGAIRVIASGTATGGAALTLTDSAASFPGNALKGMVVKILTGTGAGQKKLILGATKTVITVDNNWVTTPDATSTYVVYGGCLATSGQSTNSTGQSFSIAVASATWATNYWNGYTMEITAGTGVGQTAMITSNFANQLNWVTTLSPAPNNTSVFKVYSPAGDEVVQRSVGAFERGNTAVRETVTVRSGANALRIDGPGYHDFAVPVDASLTTVTVYGRFNSTYAGTKPRLQVLNGAECGVVDATATMTGGANAWEQLSLAFTPTSRGIVTIRLSSRSTAALGQAFFDDWGIAG